MERDDQHDAGRGKDLKHLFEDDAPEPEDADPTAELRYEGPITIEPEDEDYEDGTRGGSGRAFVTAALIFGVVVIIVAGAMLLRGGDDGSLPGLVDGVQTAEAGAPATDVAAEREAAGGIDYRQIPDVAGGGEPAAGLDLPSAPTPTEGRTRPAPTPATTPAAPATAVVEEKRAAPQPPPITRPAPREARDVLQEVTEKTPSSPPADVTPTDIRRLATAGRTREAAARGATWARARADRWTLQVALVCAAANVSKAFRNVPGDELIVVPRRYAGRDCYALCWGDFASREAAEAGRLRIPTYFGSAGKPLPRLFGDVAVP